MRGTDSRQGTIFSYVSLDARVPEAHPLRPVRAMVDGALKTMSRDFSRLYSVHGRPSIAPERLLEGNVARRFFDLVLAQAERARLTSDEHFSVDGTLIEAWASHKSYRRKDGSDNDNADGPGRNAGRNFHGKYAVTRPTPPRPTRMHGCTARMITRRRSSAMPATC